MGEGGTALSCFESVIFWLRTVNYCVLLNNVENVFMHTQEHFPSTSENAESEVVIEYGREY